MAGKIYETNAGPDAVLAGSVNGVQVEQNPVMVSGSDSWEWDDDDTPLACGVENPETCEACE